MIDSIMLVDDEDLFHIIFEDACSLLDISLSIQPYYSTDEAEVEAKDWNDGNAPKPECAFIDLNIIGSTFNGIEFIKKINDEYGNGLIIGIISSSADEVEIEKAKSVGAMFWIVKSDDIEPRLEAFKEDYPGYRDGTQLFKVYK